VAASVNGGEPVLMNQRGGDFGYLLPLEPGTNVIVLVATAPAQPQQQARRRRQGAADNEQQAKSSNMLIMERSTRYPAALNWETFGKFANGATQTVGGTVGQFTAGDGSQLSLSSLTVGGIIIPPDGSGGSYSGSFSTSLPPPDGCTNSVMPIIVSMCWTGSTFSMTYTSVCVSVPLGLLEGYEIVSRVTSWQWDGFNVIHYGCNGGWQFISRPGLEHHRIDSTFVSPCSATKNYTYNSGEWDFVAPTNCLAAPTDGWAMFADTNSWDYTCYEATTTNLMQPDRGLTFAVETNDVNCGDEAYVSNRMTETGSLTFRAPFYYPPNTPVLLTFEGMTTTNVVLHFGGTDVPPLSVDVGSGDVSFLVNVTGGLSYPINASSFTWPAASSSTTDGPDGYCFGDDGVHTRTFNSFSFTGFHNALPTCGPDVTDLVTNILSLIQAKWDSVWTNTFQRCAACASLHDIFDTVNNGLQFPGNREAGQAWDIFALKEIGFGEYNGFNNPPYRGEANTIYTNTVSFRGKCYFASAVNYSLWGKMNRLCSSFYLYPPYSNPFTLPKAEAATYLWKVMQYYSLGNTAILEAMSFTAIGYSGWNWIPSFSMPARFRSDPDNKNKITELPDKAGRWDPNWNAHPIGSHVQSWCSCQLPPF